MIKIVKTDKLVGGLHQGATIFGERELTLTAGQEKTYPINVGAGKYAIEIESTTSNNTVVFTLGTSTATFSSPSGWQAHQLQANGSLTTIKVKNNGTSTVEIKGLRIYPGKISDDQIVAHPKKATETREANLNGWYVEMDFDLDLKDDLKQGYVIYTNTKSAKNQPFRIHNIEIQKRRIRVLANHVIFDTKNMVIENVSLVGDTCASALSKLNRGTDRESPFRVNSTIEGDITQDFMMVSYFEALAELIRTFDAKVDINGFDITFREEMGSFNGVALEYGQNLQDIKVYENWDDVCTKLYPIGQDGIKLPEGYIEGTMSYDEVYAKVIDFPSELELETRDEEGNEIDNSALLISELRENAIRYVERNQVPKLAYILSSDIPQQLNLWDYVQVKHPAITNGIDKDFSVAQDSGVYDYFILVRVTKYTYDIFDERLSSIEYGEYRTNIRSIMDKVQDEVKKEFNDKFIDQEGKLKEQTDFILNMNKLGHVLIEDNEIFILDVLPKENAVDVMRIGLGGIGFSNVGIQGPFLSAWTLDGQFSADWITAGTLEGSLLRVGSIESEHLSIEAIDMIVNLSKTGGTNLITNSAGRGGIKQPWNVWAGNWDVTTDTWALGGVSKSAFTNRTSTLNDMRQQLSIQANKIHTFSFKVKKDTNSTVKIYFQFMDGNGVRVGERYGYEEVAPNPDDREFSIMIPHAPYVRGEVTLEVSGGIASVTDLLLDEGSGTYWSQAPNEIYGVDISFDADGIKVQRRNPDTNEVMGYTIMSPKEFAGYYDGKRVFTLNEDITEVMGLDVGGKGLFIKPVKMVQNTAGNGSLDIVWTGKG